MFTQDSNMSSNDGKLLKGIRPLQISDETRLIVLNFLRMNLAGIGGKCFFRRIEYVKGKDDPLKIIKHLSPDKSIPLDTFKGVSYQEIARHVEVTYRSFHCITTASDMRITCEPNEVIGKEIFLHSDRYNQLDMSCDYTFSFGDDFKLQQPTTPCIGDLAFIFIDDKDLASYKKNSLKVDGVQSKNRALPKATHWFIASEQFLRAWTAILFDWHETFDKIMGSAFTIKVGVEGVTQTDRNLALRNRLFMGNKLMTNSWLKRKLSLKFNNIEFTEKESEERYWFLRTEYVSKRWIDVYCALVLIARYGELPCPTNVPNNNDNEPKRYFWHLPEEFVSMLLSRSLNSVTTNLIINHELWCNVTKAKSNLLSKNIKNKVKLGFLDEIAKCRADLILPNTLGSQVKAIRSTGKGLKGTKSINENDFPIFESNQDHNKISSKSVKSEESIISSKNSISNGEIPEKKSSGKYSSEWVKVAKSNILISSEDFLEEIPGGKSEGFSSEVSTSKALSTCSSPLKVTNLLNKTSEIQKESRSDDEVYKIKKPKALSDDIKKKVNKRDQNSPYKKRRVSPVLEQNIATEVELDCYPKVGPKIGTTEKSSSIVLSNTCSNTVTELFYKPEKTFILSGKQLKVQPTLSVDTGLAKVVTEDLSENLSSIKLEFTIDIPHKTGDKVSWSQKILDNKDENDW